MGLFVPEPFIRQQQQKTLFWSNTAFWPATTNLCTNGGMETNSTGWTGINGSVARSSEQARFGGNSLKLTFNGGGQGGADFAITLSTSTQYVFSCWLYIDPAFSGASQIQLVTANLTGVTNNDTSQQTMAVSGNMGRWIRAYLTFTTAADGSGNIRINANSGTPADGAVVYIDGVQVEAAAVPTPYLETNGATNTRSAGRLPLAA